MQGLVYLHKQGAEIILLVRCINAIRNQILQDKVYLVIEIYIKRSNNSISYRIIDSEGYPAIYESSNFVITSNKISNFSLVIKDTSIVFTPESLYSSKLNEHHLEGFWGMFIDDNSEAKKLLREVVAELSEQEQFYISFLDF